MHMPGSRVAVICASEKELRETFEHELALGALFVPGSATLPPGRAVQVALELGFCGATLELEGEVVASLPAPLAAGAARSGVAIRLCEPVAELRRRLKGACGLDLPGADPQAANDARGTERFPARTSIRIEAGGGSFFGETADVSHSGALVMMRDPDLDPQKPVRLWIQHPASGETLELPGRVAHQTPCDDGLTGVGLQFLYDFERVDEIASFVDELRSFHHARSLATFSGSLASAPLETVLETLSHASSAGTLLLAAGDEEGKIAYREGEFLYATAGLVCGLKALGRMFRWSDARFEFQPLVEPCDAAETCMPLASAILAGAVERDEFARLDLASIEPDTSFSVDSERLVALGPKLDDLGRELCGNAAIGFPVAALVDMVTAGDARSYETILDLLASGVLRVEPA
jgi:hypothetical protein